MSVDEWIDEQTVLFIHIGIPLALGKKMLFFLKKCKLKRHCFKLNKPDIAWQVPHDSHMSAISIITEVGRMMVVSRGFLQEGRSGLITQVPGRC